MDDNVPQDAMNMALGVEELPPYVSPEIVDSISTVFTTWLFTNQAETDAENEEEQITLVRNAIAAAYITGRLDSTNQPSESLTMTGKSGVTIVINNYPG